MKVFLKLAEALANRIAAAFGGVMMRQISSEMALAEAERVARVEDRISSLAKSNPAAANLLETHLSELAGDDPSLASSLSFGRQLLADDWSLDTPAMRGDPELPKPSENRGRRRQVGGRNGRRSTSR